MMTNLKQKTKTKNNGITLIALVVTILVILIIAGVAVITLIGDNGINQRAAAAKEKSEIAGGKEETELLASAYMTDFRSGTYRTGEYAESYGTVTLADYVASQLNGKKAGDWDVTVSGKTVTISKDGRVATGTIDENGHINWNAGTNPTKGDWAYSKQGDETIITDGTVNLHIGDYVQYDPLAGVTNALAKTYKSTSDNNGYQDQEFKLSRLATTTGAGWRVLGLKEDTKQIMLVSDTVVGPGDTSESFYLKGRTGYKNGISELNNICDLYGHGTHATGGRSITVDDVNKLTGYNPDTEKYGEGNVCEYENQVTYYWDGTDYPYYTWGSNNSGNLVNSHSAGFWWFNNSTKEWVKSSKAAATTTNKSKITTLTSTFYYYSGSSKISTDSNEYKVIF